MNRAGPNPGGWSERRSAFNHHWMKNRFLSTLDAAANVMAGRLRGVRYFRELLVAELAQWPERKRELDRLLDDFEAEMSPKTTLRGTCTLSGLEANLRPLLANLVHCLWLDRRPVRYWVSNASARAETVTRCFEELWPVLPSDDSGFFNAEFVARFGAFRLACRDLSDAIAEFPNRVLVT